MSNVKFIQNGNSVMLQTLNLENAKDNLIPRVYVLKNSMTSGFYLDIQCDKFEINQSVYGDVGKKVDKVFNTFRHRKDSTGVLSTGEKGSGKSLFSKLLANKAIDEGYAVILVTEEFAGANFQTFIQNLGEVVLFFDEFEKIYEDQEQFLTVFDGVSSSKKLIALTANEVHRIDDFLLNRPSRIFYHFQYTGIDEALLLDYCEKNLDNQEHLPSIKNYSRQFFNFNFDMLKSLVEELNRYKDNDFDTLVQDLNMQPSPFKEGKKYLIQIFNEKGNKYEQNKKDTIFEGNPYDSEFTIYFNRKHSEKYPNRDRDEDQEDRIYRDYSYFSIDDLQAIEENALIFFNEDTKQKLILTPIKK